MRFDHVTFQRQKRTRLLRVLLWGFPKMDSQGKFDGLVHRLQQAFSPRFSCHGAAQLALCYRPKALLQEHRRLENRPALASLVLSPVYLGSRAVISMRHYAWWEIRRSLCL